MVGPNSQHGVAAYNKGCKCQQCTQAKNLAARRIKDNRVLRNATEIHRCPSCHRPFASARGVAVHRGHIHE